MVLRQPETEKTLLCSQYLHWVAVEKDVKVVFIGINEPKSRLIAEMSDLGLEFTGLETGGRFAYVDATEV